MKLSRTSHAVGLFLAVVMCAVPPEASAADTIPGSQIGIHSDGGMPSFWDRVLVRGAGPDGTVDLDIVKHGVDFTLVATSSPADILVELKGTGLKPHSTLPVGFVRLRLTALPTSAPGAHTISLSIAPHLSNGGRGATERFTVWVIRNRKVTSLKVNGVPSHVVPAGTEVTLTLTGDFDRTRTEVQTADVPYTIASWSAPDERTLNIRATFPASGPSRRTLAIKVANDASATTRRDCFGENYVDVGPSSGTPVTMYDVRPPEANVVAVENTVGARQEFLASGDRIDSATVRAHSTYGARLRVRILGASPRPPIRSSPGSRGVPGRLSQREADGLFEWGRGEGSFGAPARIEFSPPITVVPGQSYVLEMTATDGREFRWWQSNDPEAYLFGTLAQRNVSSIAYGGAAVAGDLWLRLDGTSSAPPRLRPTRHALLVLIENGGVLKNINESLPPGVKLSPAHAAQLNALTDTFLGQLAQVLGAMTGVNSKYDRLKILRDTEFTPGRALEALRDLAQSHVVDVHVLAHGTTDEIVANDDERVSMTTFFLPLRKAQLAGTTPLHLRVVYQMNCCGGTLLREWRGVGAEAVCGTSGETSEDAKNNYMPTQYFHFLPHWRDGSTFQHALDVSFGEARAYFDPWYAALGEAGNVDDSRLQIRGNAQVQITSP